MPSRIALRLLLFFMVGLGIFFCIESLRLKIGTFAEPGPGFMPLISGLMLGIFSLSALLATYKKGDLEASKTILNFADLKNPTLVFASISLYPFLVIKLGFFLSTFLFMLFLFKGIEPQKWYIALMAAFLSATASYFIFVIALGTQFL